MSGDGRVAAARCAGYGDAGAVRAATESALSPFGGLAAFIRPGQRVLVKPNLVRAVDPARGAVTHPAFVREVVLMAGECGAAEVLVGDSPGFGSAANAARKSGLAAALDGTGARIIEFRESVRIRDGLDNGRFRTLCQSGEVLGVDAIINLPKAKAHCQMVLTGAVKNLFGCIPGRRKALMHCMVDNSRVLFGRMLVDNARTLGAQLHLMDAIVAMEGQGPTSGDPRPWGWVMAAPDPVAMDRVMAAALGYGQEEVPHLAAAAAMGVGPRSVEEVELLGARLDGMAPDSWRRADLLPISFNPWRLGIGYLKHKIQWRTAA